MNRKIFCLISVLTLFAGCSKEAVPTPEPAPVGGMISVRSQAVLSNEPQSASEIRSKTAARSAEEVTLAYTFEAWTRGENARCVLHKTFGGTLTEAAVEIMLVPGNYDFLFWADRGKGYYTADDLRRVTLAEEPYVPGHGRDAFACVLKRVEWNGGNGIGATLTRPLAKLSVENTENFAAGESVSVVYRNLPTQYDVLTGKASVPEEIASEFPDTAAGSPLAGEDFLFVPEDAEKAVGLEVIVNGTAKRLDVLPLKANCKIRVTAAFSKIAD